MIPGFSVSRHLTHFSQSMIDKKFPVQVQIEAAITDAESAAIWLSSERERLLGILAHDGAVLDVQRGVGTSARVAAVGGGAWYGAGRDAVEACLKRVSGPKRGWTGPTRRPC